MQDFTDQHRDILLQEIESIRLALDQDGTLQFGGGMSSNLGHNSYVCPSEESSSDDQDDDLQHDVEGNNANRIIVSDDDYVSGGKSQWTAIADNGSSCPSVSESRDIIGKANTILQPAINTSEQTGGSFLHIDLDSEDAMGKPKSSVVLQEFQNMQLGDLFSEGISENDLKTVIDGGKNQSASSSTRAKPCTPEIALEQALQHNKRYQECIRDELKRINSALKKNEERQHDLIQLEYNVNQLDYSSVSSIMKFSPYFKDDVGVCPPDNPDTVKKARLEHVSPHQTRTKLWTDKERRLLTEGVKDQNLQALIGPLLKQIKELETEGKINKNVKKTGKIQRLRKEVENLMNTPTEELLRNLEGLDFERIAGLYLPKRKPFECRIQWVQLEHPCVNHGVWTKEEDASIINYAKETSKRLWGYIAEKMGTNRTPIQCLQRYQRTLNKDILKREWTKEEDKKLVEVVKQCHPISWQLVSEFMEGRTGPQCMQRYKLSVLPGAKRGRWCMEEDMQLLKAVHKYGRRWRRIQEFIPTRTEAQIRERYMNQYHPDLKFGPFSKKEDDKLVRLVEKYGMGNWAAMVPHMGGRTDSMLARRFKSLRSEDYKEYQRNVIWKRFETATNFVNRQEEKIKYNIADMKISVTPRIEAKPVPPERAKTRRRVYNKDGILAHCPLSNRRRKNVRAVEESESADEESESADEESDSADEESKSADEEAMETTESKASATMTLRTRSSRRIKSKAVGVKSHSVVRDDEKEQFEKGTDLDEKNDKVLELEDFSASEDDVASDDGDDMSDEDYVADDACFGTDNAATGWDNTCSASDNHDDDDDADNLDDNQDTDSQRDPLIEVGENVLNLYANRVPGYTFPAAQFELEHLKNCILREKDPDRKKMLLELNAAQQNRLDNLRNVVRAKGENEDIKEEASSDAMSYDKGFTDHHDSSLLDENLIKFEGVKPVIRKRPERFKDSQWCTNCDVLEEIDSISTSLASTMQMRCYSGYQRPKPSQIGSKSSLIETRNCSVPKRHRDEDPGYDFRELIQQKRLKGSYSRRRWRNEERRFSTRFKKKVSYRIGSSDEEEASEAPGKYKKLQKRARHRTLSNSDSWSGDEWHPRKKSRKVAVRRPSVVMMRGRAASGNTPSELKTKIQDMPGHLGPFTLLLQAFLININGVMQSVGRQQQVQTTNGSSVSVGGSAPTATANGTKCTNDKNTTQEAEAGSMNGEGLRHNHSVQESSARPTPITGQSDTLSHDHSKPQSSTAGNNSVVAPGLSKTTIIEPYTPDSRAIFPRILPLSPNSVSISGFRTLLLQRQKLRQLAEQAVPPGDQQSANRYRATFAYRALSARFNSLFLWPALVSTYTPRYVALRVALSKDQKYRQSMKSRLARSVKNSEEHRKILKQVLMKGENNSEAELPSSSQLVATEAGNTPLHEQLSVPPHLRPRLMGKVGAIAKALERAEKDKYWRKKAL